MSCWTLGVANLCWYHVRLIGCFALLISLFVFTFVAPAKFVDFRYRRLKLLGSGAAKWMFFIWNIFVRVYPKLVVTGCRLLVLLGSSA
uniref:Uncharacterized protein n=1 Tax=Kalanchoe fedtschenkoi TaxID=63787 RepID=A0A7N0V6K2_KALFE